MSKIQVKNNTPDKHENYWNRGHELKNLQIVFVLTTLHQTENRFFEMFFHRFQVRQNSKQMTEWHE